MYLHPFVTYIQYQIKTIYSLINFSVKEITYFYILYITIN